MEQKQVARNIPPETGLLRLSDILGNKKKPPIIPISRSAWWAGVKSGRYPQPVKLSPRCMCWKSEDIRALIEGQGAAQGR